MKMRASDVPTDMSNKKCVHHKIRPSIQIIKRYNGNDPKINRVLPLPQGNHVVKFVKDPIYRTKVICGNDSAVKKYIYSNSDLDL